MFDCPQRVLITVPLSRLIKFGKAISIASPTLGKAISIASRVRSKPHIQQCQLGLIEQTNYLRQRWMFGCVSSAKEIANNFWSSSPHANSSNNAWQLNFNNGNDNNNNRNHSNKVRLLRSGAWYASIY